MQIQFLLLVPRLLHMKLFTGFYGPDFKEKRIQIYRIKIQFIKLLKLRFKKITFRIIISENRN